MLFCLIFHLLQIYALRIFSWVQNRPRKFKKRFFILCKPYISDDLVFLPNNG